MKNKHVHTVTYISLGVCVRNASRSTGLGHDESDVIKTRAMKSVVIRSQPNPDKIMCKEFGEQ